MITAEKAKLGGLDLFDRLSNEHFSTVKSHASRVQMKAGQTLFFQRDPGDALYIMESGRAEVSVTAPSGKKLTLNMLQGGDVFGEIAALDGGPRTATVSIVEDAILLYLKRGNLVQLLTKEPGIAIELIEILCDRLRWVSQQVEDLALLSIESRLASRLVALYFKLSDVSGRMNLSQSELADLLGVTRESTNKVLQDWRARGLIDITRGSIRIIDYDALAAIAES